MYTPVVSYTVFAWWESWWRETKKIKRTNSQEKFNTNRIKSSVCWKQHFPYFLLLISWWAEKDKWQCEKEDFLWIIILFCPTAPSFWLLFKVSAFYLQINSSFINSEHSETCLKTLEASRAPDYKFSFMSIHLSKPLLF